VRRRASACLEASFFVAFLRAIPGLGSRWVLFLFLVAAPAPAGVLFAQESAPAPPASERKQLTVPGDGEKTLELTAGAGSVFGKDELLLEGYVDIRYGDLRLQADHVRYVTATKDCFAEGNVILDSGQTRLTAEKVEYNLGTELGAFYKARGYAEPSFYFEAAEVRKIDKERYVIVDATFTTCTQPVPYWSFKVSRGTIHLDNYAYLHNVSFKAEHVPIFYSPYLVWPIKEDRATGLLFPEFGYSRTRGFVFSNAFYWAIRRNMDATFYLDYYAKAGLGEGLEYRYVPNAGGKGQFTGAYIHDQVVDENRYSFNLNHRQDLPSDFRLVASLNAVSDFDYYLDFQRDLRASTTPVILSFIYLSRNWENYNFNVRAERRKQLFNVTEQLFPVPPQTTSTFVTVEEPLTNLIEPSVELRGSRRKLGQSPAYFAFEASLDNFEKAATLFTTNYQRFDLFPTFSAPIKMAPWLDINPSVGFRGTAYSKKLGAIISEDANGNGIADTGEDTGLDGIPGTGDEGEDNGVLDRQQEVLEDNFFRKIVQGSVEVIGPKFSRVFLTPDNQFSPAFKHTFEPRIFYLYQSKVDSPEEIIRYDEKDVLSGNLNTVTYSLTTRLFAKRPGATPGSPLAAGTQMFSASAHPPPPVSAEGHDLPAPASNQGPAKPDLSTVEIASFSVAQSYSFLGALSSRTRPIDAGGVIVQGSCILADGGPQESAGCQTSHFSAVDATARFNPTLFTSLDARAIYDILDQDIRSGNITAHYRNPEWGFLDFSWFFQKPAETFSVKSSQLTLQAQTAILNRRLLLGFQGHYDLVAGALQDQRYTFGYNTQCCGFTFELLDRNYVGVSQQEFRVMVNLKGIGNVLDLNSGSSSIPGMPISF
jgi:lipopolysaccharide assembly outer membrane protein LptD (OstA)